MEEILKEQSKVNVLRPAKRLICAKCRKPDHLYEDDHGTFCGQCGPSVPVKHEQDMVL